jgi:hypothetical protein
VFPVRYEMNLYVYVMQKKVDRLCGLVVRVPGYTTEMYYASSEVRNEFIYVMQKKVDRLCGLVVRVPGYTTEMYCVSSELRNEFIRICYAEESRPPLWSSGQSAWPQIRGPVSIPDATRFSEK